MRITPLDVRKQEFRRGVRGFDCDEVRAFLATLADEYETVLVDNKQLRERTADNQDKISEYKTMERTLRDTLMTAERLMQDTRESANKEGDLIIQESRLQAKRILEECRIRTEELRRELNGLRKEKETYLARFKSLGEAQIQFVESHRSDFKDVDKRLTDMVDDVLEGMGDPANPPAATPRRRSPVAANPVHVPAPAAAPTAEESAEPAPAYQPPVNAEVDQWRDYDPATGNRTETATPAASLDELLPASPEPASPTNATESPANPWQGKSWNPSQDAPANVPTAPEVPRDRPDSASVELAAMGIPLPTVSGPGETEEAIATIIEETCENTSKVPVAPYSA